MLADIAPAILQTRIERRKLTRTEINRRYRRNKRETYNAYRRKWWAARKAA